ncbi:MAG: ribosome-associated translation inhibitor RaiA [Bacteroidetes bacterium]|nr:ribosome-associated translation inhibitor RaiA [Bacteroidota bacterium]
MDIQIQSIHFTADKKLLDFIEEKIGKLNHYYDRIISSEVFLRLDRSGESANKIAEIRLSVPGNDLYVKRQCKTFEEAVDSGIAALSKQVKRYKEKQKAY